MNTEKQKAIETYTCTDRKYNGRMGVNECYSNQTTVFYFDYHNRVHIGDIVDLERLPNGLYGKMWVNGKSFESA